MRPRHVILGVASLAMVMLCLAGWAVASPCSGAGRCAAAAVPALVLLAALLLAGGSVVAWLTTVAGLLLAARRDIRPLSPGLAPPQILAHARHSGLERIRWLATDTPVAFCAGGLRPAVYLSSGLVGALRPDELEAVLLHEGEHRRRYEPLRRAARHAAADVWFYVPMVRWWAERQLERSEVAADAEVLRRIGAAPLAGALCRVDAVVSGRAAAAFGGAAESRVAQLLGDPLPRRRPTAWTWCASVAGLALMVSVLLCVTQVLGGV